MNWISLQPLKTKTEPKVNSWQ